MRITSTPLRLKDKACGLQSSATHPFRFPFPSFAFGSTSSGIQNELVIMTGPVTPSLNSRTSGG